MKDKKNIPEYKPMKDQLALLLGANASSDMKLKPLLVYVYYSENARAFRTNFTVKERFPVMWRWNEREWVKQVLFNEWLFKVYAPSIKDYLQTNELPLKALLVLDNASDPQKTLKIICWKPSLSDSSVSASKYHFIDSANGSGGYCRFQEIVHSCTALSAF